MKTPEIDPLPTRWTLVERLKNLDDHGSWQVFFETYRNLIYGVAVKAGLNHAQAEDVVQEVVVNVTRNIAGFEANPARGSFKAWLLTMTRWRIIDQIRAGKRGVEVAVDTNNDKTSTRLEDRVPDPRGNVLDEIWETAWKAHLLEAALKKLKQQASGKHFQIFYLSTIKGVAPASVAQALGVKVDQVYLIRHRLTKLMEETVQELETQLG